MKIFKRQSQASNELTMISESFEDILMMEGEREDDENQCKESSNSDVGSSGTQPHETGSSIGIAESEALAVKRSKLFVYVVLTVFALSMAVAVWFYVRGEENSTFESDFGDFANEVLDGSNKKAVTIFKQLATLSIAITSQALDRQLDWPFVTLPHFYKITEELGALTGAEIIIFTPIVPLNRQQEWENFVLSSRDEIIADTFRNTFEILGSFATNITPVPQEQNQSTNPGMLEPEFILPAIQFGPSAESASLINMDLNTHPAIQRIARDAMKVSHPIISQDRNLKFLFDYSGSSYGVSNMSKSIIVEPVFDSFQDASRKVVGFVFAVERWESYLEGNSPSDKRGFLVDVKDSCGVDMSFSIEGDNVDFKGYEDLHDPKYESIGQKGEFASFARYDRNIVDDGLTHCNFSMTVYPEDTFQSEYHTSEPFIFASVILAVFICTIGVFAFYDWMVARRQAKVLGAAKTTTAIIQSLFPKNVGERLLADAREKAVAKEKQPKGKLDFLLEEENNKTDNPFQSDPIAEYYTDTTIMFADIVGFTAWSSTREPKQVFQLLETIYHDFDAIARKRRVFKVETVGDCYVAACGLPTPRPDHHVVIARFARDCLYRFQALVHMLEVELGPDTADLSIRLGIHSGQVTAGVLRGDKARFQLFGDTMNTASRMESTSQAARIQCSQETADKLRESGKGHWVRPREDIVMAKGKGAMQTYWLDLKVEGPRSSTSGNNSERGSESEGVKTARIYAKTILGGHSDKACMMKEARLVKWNVEILTKILRMISVRRVDTISESDILSDTKMRKLEVSVLDGKSAVLDEVQEIITLPDYKSYQSKTLAEGVDIELDDCVKTQLSDYMQTLAKMYRDNPFHNFEHASHVCMSVVKLLSRIVAPALQATGDETDAERTLHDHTYGITSDPLTQFACALSAAIHDVDHTGVPNNQLVKEGQNIAATYNNKSVAEQNSVDLAWSMLMEDRFKDLRRAIYTTKDEFRRFRQLIVNSVMATDIMDKDLGLQRKDRWLKAFSECAPDNDAPDNNVVNRKATIVIEHLIQASDVAHTMQHWQIYQKWNQRLFLEMFRAYKEGRAEKDPSEFWYQGEVGFFEFYIIPLAKKLKDCGVFGVSSDEYLNYALRNKREWQTRGHQIVAEFKEKALLEYANNAHGDLLEEEESFSEQHVDEVFECDPV